MMDCTRLSHLLSAFIDDELDAEEKRQVRQHLVSCRQCNDSLDQLKEVRCLLGRLESIKPYHDFSALVKEELSHSVTIEFVPGNHKVISRGLMLAAAAALIGIFSMNGLVRNAKPDGYAQENPQRKVQVVSDSPTEAPPFTDRHYYFPVTLGNGSSSAWSIKSVVAGQNPATIFDDTSSGFYELNLFPSGQYR